MRQNKMFCRQSVFERIEPDASFSLFAARAGAALRVSPISFDLLPCRHFTVSKASDLYGRVTQLGEHAARSDSVNAVQKLRRIGLDSKLRLVIRDTQPLDHKYFPCSSRLAAAELSSRHDANTACLPIRGAACAITPFLHQHTMNLMRSRVSAVSPPSDAEQPTHFSAPRRQAFR
jgi:hypothetical protein